jgi:pantoate--beta-alanine ligase
MEKITDVRLMQQCAEALRLSGKRIAFVPTMGYLHEGHLSLLDEARTHCDISVMSIFVNPTQFGPQEDFGSYPRDLQRDLQLAEARGADIVFIPGTQDMYPGEPLTKVEVSKITEVLCGASRKGHFSGVATVVTKLFNIVKPHVAVFGQKDAQQAAVIMKMVQDLNMDVEIRIAPIVREADGLAMSSRNVRLKPEDRHNALVLSRTLFKIRDALLKGASLTASLEAGRETIRKTPGARLEYLEARSFPELEILDEVIPGQDCLLAVAAHFGNVRLIDNVIVGKKH